MALLMQKKIMAKNKQRRNNLLTNTLPIISLLSKRIQQFVWFFFSVDVVFASKSEPDRHFVFYVYNTLHAHHSSKAAIVLCWQKRVCYVIFLFLLACLVRSSIRSYMLVSPQKNTICQRKRNKFLFGHFIYSKFSFCMERVSITVNE